MRVMAFASPERRAEWARNNYWRNREAELARARKRRLDHPEQQRAHHAVNNALRDGRLTKGPCEREPWGDCWGRMEAHHDDYSKPLDVRWFCSSHHGLEHA
jgi:hypothetical protein